MRCPNCDTLLNVDMKEWWNERNFKRAVCPVCGWRDDERFQHSKYKYVLRKIGGEEAAPESINITETITINGKTKKRRV